MTQDTAELLSKIEDLQYENTVLKEDAKRLSANYTLLDESYSKLLVEHSKLKDELDHERILSKNWKPIAEEAKLRYDKLVSKMRDKGLEPKEFGI